MRQGTSTRCTGGNVTLGAEEQELVSKNGRGLDFPQYRGDSIFASTDK